MEHIKEVLGNLPSGTNTQNQTIEPEPAEPTLEEKREELRKSLGVASLENTFENFDLVPGTEKVLAAFKALASGKTLWKILLVYGGTGNGKTHLCDAAVIALYKREIRCRVLTMAGIMQALKNAMEHDRHGNEGKPWTPYAELLNDFGGRDYLIIDDVGMGGSGSTWEWGQLEEIIGVRYHENLFTILTSNLDIKQDPKNKEIPFLPERIVSRFRRDPSIGRLILNKGPEYKGREK